jgi:hypothetical protein
MKLIMRWIIGWLGGWELRRGIQYSEGGFGGARRHRRCLSGSTRAERLRKSPFIRRRRRSCHHNATVDRRDDNQGEGMKTDNGEQDLQEIIFLPNQL